MKELFLRYRTLITFVGLLLLSVGGMWFSGKTTMASPKDLGMAVVSLFQQGSAAGFGFVANTLTSVQQLAELRADYEKLVDRIHTYEEKLSDIEQLHAENLRLREVLAFSGNLGYQNIPAQLIGKDPGIIFNTLTLNKGYNQGVRKGMPVIAIQNGLQGLVGKVMSVGPMTSQVLPVFDSRNFIGARLERSRYEGLVNGGGASDKDLRMIYIDPVAKTAISVDDMVITSGLNSMYPPNLIVGKVSSIQAKPYETSIELTVHPFIEFTKMEYVYVLATTSGVE
jgi:rod shape-determining protein MreC